MAIVNIYLNFAGHTEEAFNFYKSVFGGEFMILQRYKDMPEMPGLPKVSDEDKEKVMHVSLPLSNGNVLMGTDALESMGRPLTVGNNFSISLNTESEEETDRLFNALSEGGTVTMSPQKTFWNAYFGSCTDKFGIQWMANYEYDKQQ